MPQFSYLQHEAADNLPYPLHKYEFTKVIELQLKVNISIKPESFTFQVRS